MDLTEAFVLIYLSLYLSRRGVASSARPLAGQRASEGAILQLAGRTVPIVVTLCGCPFSKVRSCAMQPTTTAASFLSWAASST